MNEKILNFPQHVRGVEKSGQSFGKQAFDKVGKQVGKQVGRQVSRQLGAFYIYVTHHPKAYFFKKMIKNRQKAFDKLVVHSEVER